MTAEEMFKTLGYKKTHDNRNFLIYSKPMELMEAQVRFNKACECVLKVAVIGSSMMVDSYLDIWAKELKAISQQCVELGWLDDK